MNSVVGRMRPSDRCPVRRTSTGVPGAIRKRNPLRIEEELRRFAKAVSWNAVAWERQFREWVYDRVARKRRNHRPVRPLWGQT